MIAQQVPLRPQICQSHAGFSLLEVLVASGILVIGLAAVASLLPAAASRLDEAIQIDRAVTFSANVHADLLVRRDDIFDPNHLPSTITVFGNPLLASQAAAAHENIVIHQNFENLFRNAEWWGPDALEVRRSTSGLPDNLFSGNDRAIRQEMCWLATLSTPTASPAAGAHAVLSIVVFKKPDIETKSVDLTSIGGDVFQAALTDEIRRACVGSCSYVLDPGKLPPASPWLRVRSSWTQGSSADPDSTDTRLIFDAAPSATPVTVIAFENIVRVDSYPIILE